MSKTGTTAQRHKILCKHILYEIQMFRYSRKMWRTLPPNQAEVNLLIECFCLHARNLIDFFWKGERPGAKNAVARHFTDNDNYTPFGGICPQKKTEGLYGKLNKQISHITYDRTDEDAKKLNPDNREFLYKMIEDEIENFRTHIREPYTKYRDLYSEGDESLKLRTTPSSVTSQPYIVVSGGPLIKPQD